MSCRRAYELDLAAFAADPRAETFADFREHYPTCAECASEVRVWTELEDRLRQTALSAHPESSELLEFEQAPRTLAVARRRAIEAHLERCLSCADELEALRSFDFGALAPAAPRRGLLGRLAGLIGGTRALVLHPAFAYAIVLLLLYPAATGVLDALGPLAPSPAFLSEAFDREPRSPLAARAPAPASETKKQRSESKKQRARDLPETQERDEALENEKRAAFSEAPKASEAAADREIERKLAAADRFDDQAGAAPAEQTQEPARAPTTVGRASEVAEAETVLEESRRPTRVADSAAVVAADSQNEPRREAFAGGARMQLDPAGKEAPRVLRHNVRSPRLLVPLAARTEAGDSVGIRITSLQSGREYRDRLELEEGALDVLELELPEGWLTSGHYELEVQLEDPSKDAAATRRYVLDVYDD